MEKGVNLRLIQQYLGHRSPRTTAIYTHLTQTAYAAGYKAIDDCRERVPELRNLGGEHWAACHRV